MALVNSLCYMLATTPFQRENYSRLIIGIIVQYYQKFNSHYKGEHLLSKESLHLYLRDRLADIVASDSYTDGRLPLAASWSQREDILANLGELQHSPVSRFLVICTCSTAEYHEQAADVRAREELSKQESKLELPLLPRDHKGLEIKDIIGSKEKFASLADLYHTTVSIQ